MQATSQVRLTNNVYVFSKIIKFFLFCLGGGNVKIETKKLDIKATSRIEAKNDAYSPRGGEKKVNSRLRNYFLFSRPTSFNTIDHF